MKIVFKNDFKERGDSVLFVSIASLNSPEDSSQKNYEIVKENGIKTLYLKHDENMTLRKLFLLVRKMVKAGKNANAGKLVFNFDDFKFKSIELTDEELGELIGTQLDFANYEFAEYKTETKNDSLVKEVIIKNCPLNVQKFVMKGQIIAQEVNNTRTLSNTPGGDMTPKILAQKAKEAVKGLPVKVTILGEKEMEKLKMQAILSVGRGSDEESKFIIMEYWGCKSRENSRDGKSEKPIVLVGKGVTFDSGGINLKPSSSLLGMNMDMSGGAAVMHTLSLVAKMKLKKNVIVLIPAVENMVSGKSYRTGDVVRSMSGKTIEILDTDAEGRVVLADALTYSKKYNPEIVIDVATLTGAAMVALGERMSAIFTENDDIAKDLEIAGAKTADYVWRLPMWEEYENEISGSLGDFTNIHNKNSRYGGASYGAVFLHQFIKNKTKEKNNIKWVHIDMAPRMVAMSDENLAVGAVGAPVRLLYKFIEEYKN